MERYTLLPFGQAFWNLNLPGREETSGSVLGRRGCTGHCPSGVGVVGAGLNQIVDGAESKNVAKLIDAGFFFTSRLLLFGLRISI